MSPLVRASSNGAIDLDRYAEINALVRHFPEDKKDEVVARLGLRRRDWAAASTRWTKDLEASLDDGRPDLIKRYSGSFARARRRLSSLRPSLESLGPLPVPFPEAEEDAVIDQELPEPAEPRVEAPSYMVHPAPVSPGGPPRPSFAIPAPWAAPEPLPAVAEVRPVAAVVPEVVARPVAATPEVARPVAAAPEVARPAAVAAPAAAAGVTAPAAAAAVPEVVARPVVAVAGLAAAAPPGATMAFKAPVVIKPMPFQAQEAAPEKALERAVAHAAAVQGPARAKSTPLDATMEGVMPIPGRALPFGKAARPIPEYTVERYASLRTELRHYPDRADAVLARYKLDRETCSALDDDWAARFAADATLRSKFIDACEKYGAWLRARDGAKKA